jgi:nucleotide-binding universal stress UspA family protein
MKRITWFTNSRAMVESLLRIRGVERPCAGKSDYLRFDRAPDYGNTFRKNPVQSLPDEQPEATDDSVVVVSIDFSPLSQDAAQVAVSIAQHTHARLVLCHAIFLNINSFAPDYPPWLAEELRKDAIDKMEPIMNLARKAGVTATCVIEEGTPAGVTLKAARRHAASLIVLTDRKHGMWARLLFGPTTTEQVTCEADCHVMVVRANPKLKNARSRL